VMLSRFNGANGNGTTAAAPFPTEATRDSLFGNTESFNGLVNIGTDTTINARSLTFNGAVESINGNHNLTTPLSTGPFNGVSFNGPVGDVTPLQSLTTGTGKLFINAGSITTIGSQSYPGFDTTFGTPLTFGSDTVLKSTGGGNITLGAAPSGAVNLTLNTSGTVTLPGHGDATSITITSPSNTTINAPGGDITNTTINAPGNVVLNATTVGGVGGSITGVTVMATNPGLALTISADKGFSVTEALAVLS